MTKNRIDLTLARLKEEKRAMLSPYITAGDPNREITLPLMHGLVEAGADILELGIPFSDPMAEGPVIQAAMERALENQVTIEDVLHWVQEFRVTDKKTPIVLMGYLNPIEQYGYERFAHEAAKAGVDGTILVDLPPEESEEILQIWKNHNLYPIFLCSVTTSANRMKRINDCAQGYLYYVSLKGVTGAAAADQALTKQQYLLRKEQTNLPLMLGFGIKTPAMAQEVSSYANGVIVGAALIQTMVDAGRDNHDKIKAATTFIAALRQAMDNR